MNKNQNEVVKRGRPPVALVLPRSCEFTVNDLMERNNVCRLTAYNHLKELSVGKNSELYRSEITRPTGSVGKPMDVFFKRALITPEIQADIDTREAEAVSARRKRSAIKAAKARKSTTPKKHKTPKARKLVNSPAIEMTPAPEPVLPVSTASEESVTVPVESVSEVTPEPVPVVTEQELVNA
jgi:hypothetical protein